jgi:hypothetical protein
MQETNSKRFSFAILLLIEDILLYGGLFYLLELNKRFSYPVLQISVYLAYLLSFVFIKINIDFLQWKARRLLVANFCCLIILLLIVLCCLFTFQIYENLSPLVLYLALAFIFSFLFIAYRISRNILK